MAKSILSYFNKPRVEAFSDGIFAVIITLLVLELHIPPIAHAHSQAELYLALIRLIPKLISWVVSFLIICVIWVSHHRIFEELKAVTHRLFWLNANLLLWCTLIPFPTALLGDYSHNATALIVFGCILALMSGSFTILRVYIIHNPSVLVESIDIVQYKKTTKWSVLFGPLAYGAGAVCSLVHPYLSFGVYAFVPLYFIFSQRGGDTLRKPFL